MIVRLRGVKAVRTKGKVYFYHAKTRTRLPDDPRSAEFIARLRELERRAPPGGKPSTLRALLVAYQASPEYRDLAPGSKREYGKAIKYLDPQCDTELFEFTTAGIYRLRDKLAAKYSRSAANRTVLFLRLLFAWGKKRSKVRTNPALDVDLVRRPKDAPTVNRRWKDAEVETVLAEAPPWLRVPVAIAVYTGMRLSDVARVAWSSYDGREFEARQWKTGNPVWVPAHERLRAILDTAPRIASQIVVGVHGKPMSANSLGSRFFIFMAELRGMGKVGPGLSFHGLRHTCGTRLAEAGCDPPTIAAVLGQSTTRMAEHYSRTADRRRLAGTAIERMEERDRNANPENFRKTVQ